MKKSYPCIEVNLSKIKHNAKEIGGLCNRKGIEVVAVSKVFCAKKPIVKALLSAGIKVIADSRMENLKRIEDLPCKKMLLRIPMESNVQEVVKYCDLSLNSELETIEMLSQAAKKEKKVHGVILMVDLGDLREGLLEKDVIAVVEKINKLSNVELCGIGTNLTCYGGVIPDEKNLGVLIKLKEEIKTTLHLELPIISGGNSSSLYLVIKEGMPQGITQLRIGEAIVLGRETAFGESIANCYHDVFILKGEIIEMKEKPSMPTGNIGMDAFGNKPSFEDRGVIKRGIVALGRQDIDSEGIVPIDPNIEILGASSDHLLLDLSKSDKNYELGDRVEFTMDYGCLLRAMTSPYVKKYYQD